MNFLSLFSGIEAASVASRPLGWKCLAVAEVDPFCCALLRHRYPDVPNLGDVTSPDFVERARKAINGSTLDAVVFGSPCQGFSVAGKRLGLDDPRSNLALHALRICRELAPAWIVFENVPGLFSSWSGAPEGPTGVEVGFENEGTYACEFIESSDFAEFLQWVSDIGYFGAWTVLDAQYFGLAQRRERVFFVGHFRDWRAAAAVLLEPESVSGNYPPSREAGKGPTGTINARTKGGGGLGTDFELGGGLVPETAFALNAKGGGGRIDGESETFVACPLTGNPYGDHESRESLLTVATLDASYARLQGCSGQDLNHGHSYLTVAHALRADGFDASEDGTGRGTPLVPVISPCLTGNYGKQPDNSDTSAGPMLLPVAIGFYGNDSGNDATEELAPTLRSMDGGGGNHPAVAFTERGREQGRTFECQEDLAYCVTNPGSGGRTHSRQVMTPKMAVRRLTPRECERLQGFEDDYTAVPYRGKPAADGPRYRALGNSWAIPCVRWIFERMEIVDHIMKESEERS